MGRYFLIVQPDASSQILGFGCNNFSSVVSVDLILRILEFYTEKTFQKCITLSHSDRKLIYFALKQQTFAEADVKLLQINFLPVLLCFFQRFMVHLTGSVLRECDGIRHAPQPAVLGRHFTSVSLSNHTGIV